jgi:hypothetical protein
MHPEDTGYTLEGLGDPDGDLVNRLYPPQALSTMLKECDYVVVTLPRTKSRVSPGEGAGCTKPAPIGGHPARI